jgi:glycerophosphoryl diester phosphodiesterase
VTERHIAVIGHRGARNLEPENTLRSFRRALELGVDYIECDVHRTRDEHLVLMHDDTLDRTTDGTGAVSELTFPQIRALDAGKGERVPTLQELLDLVGARVRLCVELKDPTALDLVLGLVADRGVADQVFLTSGDTALLERLHAREPHIRLEHIFGQPPPDAVARAVSAGASRVSCHFTKLTQAFVDECHGHGIEVIGWPPNTRQEQVLTAGYGVDLICSDRPDILIATLSELGLRLV